MLPGQPMPSVARLAKAETIPFKYMHRSNLLNKRSHHPHAWCVVPTRQSMAALQENKRMNPFTKKKEIVQMLSCVVEHYF
jgi:hypothetical protein